MRIPSLTIRAAGKPDVRVDNGPIRFIKRITVEGVPKAGDSLPLSTRFGDPFACTVTRADWSEDKELSHRVVHLCTAFDHGRRAPRLADRPRLGDETASVETAPPRDKALAAGFTGYLVKPVIAAAIVRDISILLT